MWSFGCILLELYLGIPIFPGTSGYDQLLKIFEILGLPDNKMIEESQNKGKYFYLEKNKYQYKSVAQFEKENKLQLPPIKRYHNLKTLADIKKVYRKSQLRQKASSKDEAKLDDFLDLLTKVLQINPDERMKVEDAYQHPFFKRSSANKDKK